MGGERIRLEDLLERYGFRSDECILDLSALPLASGLTGFRQAWIPDTLRSLIEVGRQNPKAWDTVASLVGRSTRRRFALENLRGGIEKGLMGEVKMSYLSEEHLEPKLNSFLREVIQSRRYRVEFSPARDVLSEVVAQTLAGAAKLKIPVVMTTRRLANDARRALDIHEFSRIRLDNIHESKQRFFESRFAGIEQTRGIRWALGFVLGTGLSLVLPPLPAFSIGATLNIIDP